MGKITADIKLGYSCNNDCVHCVIVKQRENSRIKRGDIDLETQEYFKEILFAKEKGAEKLVVTGGEPTIRKDFFKVLKFIKENNFEVFLQSNGRAFSSREFVKNTIGYIDVYMIALLGSNEKIHDKITKSKGSFEQTLQGLKNLVEQGCLVGVKSVINNYNKGDMLEIIKLLKSIGINNLSLTFPHIKRAESKDFIDEIIPYYHEVSEEIEKCLIFAIENDFQLELEAFLPCIFKGEYDLKYFTDFNVRSKDSMLKQLDMDEFMLRNDAIGVISKSKGIICSKCVYNFICPGYWKEYVELRGFDDFSPVKKIPENLRSFLLEKFKEWKR
jgi:MoaA/NifB/PqqE/SkfB family radical SAM enzyme